MLGRVNKHTQAIQKDSVLIVTSVMELFLFLMHGPTDVRIRKKGTASPAATIKNSAKPKAVSATAQGL